MYDLKLLEQARLPIDDLIYMTSSNRVYPLSKCHAPNRVWPMFSNITLRLVRDFRESAMSHVEKVKKDPSKYGYLYFLADNDKEWFNATRFNYQSFPLIDHQERKCILDEIRKAARRVMPGGDGGGGDDGKNVAAATTKAQFDATCLYLVYYFALLVNPRSNWVTMDHLSNGNQYHKHATRLDWKQISPEGGGKRRRV